MVIGWVGEGTVKGLVVVVVVKKILSKENKFQNSIILHSSATQKFKVVAY